MILKLTSIFTDRKQENAAYKLYSSIVVKSRQPEFYTDFGVQDTFDCRFDMLVVHIFLVLHRLKMDHGQTSDMAQKIFDIMFADMDQSLRETGVGDMGIGKRIKAMARAFYGRLAAYEEGLEGDDNVMGNALKRNLFRNMKPNDNDVARMARYVRRSAAMLATQKTGSLLSGKVEFAELSETT